MAIAEHIITDPQAIFDHVVRHLSEQGRPGRQNGITRGICVYRTTTGAACAFGCLIPDAMYDDKMEGNLAHDLISKRDEMRAWNTPYTKALLRALQKAHDDAPVTDDGAWDMYFTRNGRISDRLFDVADIFGLKNDEVYDF